MVNQENSICSELRHELVEVKSVLVDLDVIRKESEAAMNMLPAIEQADMIENRLAEIKCKLEKLEPLSELRLKAQYERQLETLNISGQLEKLSSGELGIIGVDGKEYPLPTMQEIRTRIKNNSEVLKRKSEQGFTRLLLVPFAVPLTKTIDHFGKSLVRHKNARKLFLTEDMDIRSELEVDCDEPYKEFTPWRGADESGYLQYFPSAFNPLTSSGQAMTHGGKSKSRLLASDQANGWQILLIEDMASLPFKDNAKIIAGRMQFAAGISSNEVLKRMQNVPEYINEVGFTPEAWLALASSNLEEKNIVTDSWQEIGRASYCTGAYFMIANKIPTASWDTGMNQAVFHGYLPDNNDIYNCARTSVPI